MKTISERLPAALIFPHAKRTPQGVLLGDNLFQMPWVSLCRQPSGRIFYNRIKGLNRLVCQVILIDRLQELRL